MVFENCRRWRRSVAQVRRSGSRSKLDSQSEISSDEASFRGHSDFHSLSLHISAAASRVRVSRNNAQYHRRWKYPGRIRVYLEKSIVVAWRQRIVLPTCSRPSCFISLEAKCQTDRESWMLCSPVFRSDRTFVASSALDFKDSMM